MNEGLGHQMNGPLNNVVVLDLTRVLAGPYLTMVMADMGARVIKVELPDLGDDARHFGPYINGRSAYFDSINRGKESIALNLKLQEDRAIFERLVRQSDVLVENYRAGTMEKLDYGWERLQGINPQLIYGAVSGFGQTGPYRHRAAYDMVVQGMGGVMSLTGTDDSGPVRVGTSIGDITAGLFGLSGVLAALYARERSGRGMMVDVGMLDCQVAILENAISRYFSNGEVPGPLGMRHPSITPFAGFKAKGGESIVIAAGNDILFQKLCGVLDCHELITDSRFATNDMRTVHFEPLFEIIEKSLSQKSVGEWLVLLEQAGVPCGPINNVEQVVNDQHVRSRNMIVTATDTDGTTMSMSGNPVKFSGYEDHAKRRAAPALDSDRQDILAWLVQREREAVRTH